MTSIIIGVVILMVVIFITVFLGTILVGTPIAIFLAFRKVIKRKKEIKNII